MPGARREVVQAIDRAQECRLTAPGRTDQRRNRVAGDRDRDAVQGLARAVQEIVGVGLQDGRMGGCAGRLLPFDTAHLPIGPSAHRRRHPNRPVIYASVCSTLGFMNSSFVLSTSTRLPRYMKAV